MDSAGFYGKEGLAKFEGRTAKFGTEEKFWGFNFSSVPNFAASLRGYNPHTILHALL
jgi:hypothetical protein